MKIWFQNRRMKWRNSKERELIAQGGCREQTLPTKHNPNPDLSDPLPAAAAAAAAAAEAKEQIGFPPPPPVSSAGGGGSMMAAAMAAAAAHLQRDR